MRATRGGSFYVGDRLPGIESNTEVTKPDGSVSVGEADANLPGIYTIRQGGEVLRYAVNVPFEESRLDPVLPEVFVAQGVTLAGEAENSSPLSESEKIRLETVELEAQQKFLEMAGPRRHPDSARRNLAGEWWFTTRRQGRRTG